MPAVSAAAGMGWTKMAGLFASAMFKGLTPVFALFACIGVAGWWRTWKRRDHQAMFYTVLLFLLAIWIHLNICAGDLEALLPAHRAGDEPVGRLGSAGMFRQLSRWAESRRWGLAGQALGVVAAAAVLRRILAGERALERLPPARRPGRVGPLDAQRVRPLARGARARRRDAGGDVLCPRAL